MTDKKISFGRIFWPSLWAALIVSIIGILIWVIVISSVVSGLEPKPLTVEENTVLYMELDGKVAEKGQTKLNPGSFELESTLGLSAILHGLEEGRKDSRIKGLFIELGNLSCGMATAKELHDAINKFEKSGKFVVAYNSGEAISTKNYYIASAANENYGFPTSNIQFLGLGAELSYFKGTLDKLNVEAQVIRGSDNHFKSAVEPFFRTNMSDSARLQNEVYLKSIWGDMLADISKERGISVDDLNQLAENADVMDVNDAVEHKLIDAAKYRDEVIKIIEDKLKLAEGQEIEMMDFGKFATKRFQQNQALIEPDANIAVILAEGGVAKSGNGLTSDQICKLFQKVRNNENIKTVVFRINSPGGSALASDEIWREVELTNQKKKVIVSMGDLAASGGYYIASPGSYIFAEPTTITGSIGVFGVIPYTGAMFENKMGMTFDRVQTNQHSILTTNRRLTEDELALIQESVDDIYDQFKGRVATGRGMTKETVNVVGRGRVWTGRDALKIGLVDELGGISDAIEYAAKEAKITDKKVLYYPRVKEDKLGEFLAQLEEQEEEEDATVSIETQQLPASLVQYYEQLKRIENISGIQMRMPFEVIIK